MVSFLEACEWTSQPDLPWEKFRNCCSSSSQSEAANVALLLEAVVGPWQAFPPERREDVAGRVPRHQFWRNLGNRRLDDVGSGNIIIIMW